MRTIETTATVTEDGKLMAMAPPGIAPGQHQVVIVIDEQPAPKHGDGLSDFPVHDRGPWPANLSLRREDMYDNWGR